MNCLLYKKHVANQNFKILIKFDNISTYMVAADCWMDIDKRKNHGSNKTQVRTSRNLSELMQGR